MDVTMEKTQQTPGSAPHRRRRRRSPGNGGGSAPQQPRREGDATRPAEPRPQPQNVQQPPKGARPARGRRPAQGQPKPQAEIPAQPPKPPRPRNAAQPPKREPAAKPQASRPARAPRPRAEEETTGLELISRRPPKQKFASFDEYLSAHGGITAPLPPEPEQTEPLPQAASAAPETPAEAE